MEWAHVTRARFSQARQHLNALNALSRLIRSNDLSAYSLSCHPMGWFFICQFYSTPSSIIIRSLFTITQQIYHPKNLNKTAELRCWSEVTNLIKDLFMCQFGFWDGVPFSRHLSIFTRLRPWECRRTLVSIVECLFHFDMQLFIYYMLHSSHFSLLFESQVCTIVGYNVYTWCSLKCACMSNDQGNRAHNDCVKSDCSGSMIENGHSVIGVDEISPNRSSMGCYSIESMDCYWNGFRFFAAGLEWSNRQLSHHVHMVWSNHYQINKIPLAALWRSWSHGTNCARLNKMLNCVWRQVKVVMYRVKSHPFV